MAMFTPDRTEEEAKKAQALKRKQNSIAPLNEAQAAIVLRRE